MDKKERKKVKENSGAEAAREDSLREYQDPEQAKAPAELQPEPPPGAEAEPAAGTGRAAQGDGLEEGETLSALERERLAWRQEKDDLVGMLQRKQADLDNFRRISRAEHEAAREYGLFTFLGKLLPVLDNLERALQSARCEGVPGSYVEGLDMICKQLWLLLEQEGAAEIEALGKPFDPHYHHAVLQTNEGEAEPGTVLEELQKGYLFKKRVLRPAMVKVFQD